MYQHGSITLRIYGSSASTVMHCDLSRAEKTKDNIWSLERGQLFTKTINIMLSFSCAHKRKKHQRGIMSTHRIKQIYFQPFFGTFVCSGTSSMTDLLKWMSKLKTNIRPEWKVLAAIYKFSFLAKSSSFSRKVEARILLLFHVISSRKFRAERERKRANSGIKI